MRSRHTHDGRTIEALYVGPLSYAIRLIAGGRYLTPRLPMSYDQLERIQQGWTEGDVTIRETRTGFEVLFMGEPFLDLGSYAWLQLTDPILEADPTRFEEPTQTWART